MKYYQKTPEKYISVTFCMLLTKLPTNFYKVLLGVIFSIAWARILYLIWPQPSFLTFLWFYLLIGSIVLKWVIFEIIDRINKRLKLRAVKRELEESDTRVTEARKENIGETSKEMQLEIVTNIDNKKRLKDITDSVVSLARVIEEATSLSLEALTKFDKNLATQVIANDIQIDQKEFEIRHECINILSNDNLSISDLHIIVSILGIVTELERMGDYATGIANIALMIGEKPPLKLLVDIPLMAKRSVNMLQDSIISFSDKDIQKAKSVAKMDDDIDKLYDNTFHKLIFAMIDNSENVTLATRLIWVSHNIERYADRITNICEWIVYGITGEMIEIGASNY
jgi:phosphate transport system protein